MSLDRFLTKEQETAKIALLFLIKLTMEIIEFFNDIHEGDIDQYDRKDYIEDVIKQLEIGNHDLQKNIEALGGLESAVDIMTGHTAERLREKNNGEWRAETVSYYTESLQDFPDDVEEYRREFDKLVAFFESTKACVTKH